MIGQNNIVRLSTDLECEVAEGRKQVASGFQHKTRQTLSPLSRNGCTCLYRLILTAL